LGHVPLPRNDSAPTLSSDTFSLRSVDEKLFKSRSSRVLSSTVQTGTLVHVSAIVTQLVFEHAGAGQGARVVLRDRGDGAVAAPAVETLGVPVVLVVREGARAEPRICGVDEGAGRSGPLGGRQGDGQHQAQGKGGEPDGSYVIAYRLHGTLRRHLPRST